MSLKRRPLVFQRAAAVVAAAVLASSVFSAPAQGLGVALPLVAAQAPRITQSSVVMPGGVTRVNIVPTSNGITQMELGQLKVSFAVVPSRIAPELAMVPDLLTADGIETDLQHAALLSVHEVFAPLSITDIKTSPQIVADKIGQRIQQRLDQAYNGQSPYVINRVVLDDACVVKFGTVSELCTPAFVSQKLAQRPERMASASRPKM